MYMAENNSFGTKLYMNSDSSEEKHEAGCVIGIQRATRFSPNSVDNDLAILNSVVSPFKGKIVQEDNISMISALHKVVPKVIFSMARSKEALSALTELERQGVLVINSPESISNCQRSGLEVLMRANGIPVPPPDDGKGNGYWLKRGDAAAQSHGDVVFCKDKEALNAAIAEFKSRGITDYLVQSHIEGDLIKFYGVCPHAIANEKAGSFFRTFYPSDDGLSKFGDERLNGKAQHFAFNKRALQREAEQVACLTGVAIYGGDAIVSADGSFVIIDFNDWPSFSRCRNDAARAIAALL